MGLGERMTLVEEKLKSRGRTYRSLRGFDEGREEML